MRSQQASLAVSRPLTQSGQVNLVMHEQVVCEELPREPVFWHLLEALGSVQVFIAQHLSCFKEIGVAVLLPRKDLLQRTLAVLP